MLEHQINNNSKQMYSCCFTLFCFVWLPGINYNIIKKDKNAVTMFWYARTPSLRKLSLSLDSFMMRLSIIFCRGEHRLRQRNQRPILSTMNRPKSQASDSSGIHQKLLKQQKDPNRNRLFSPWKFQELCICIHMHTIYTEIL